MGTYQRKAARLLKTFEKGFLTPFLAGLLFVGCGGAPEPAPRPSPRLSVVGHGGHVLMGHVSLPKGAQFYLPTSRCQDALVFVEHGSIRAGETSVKRGRAVRFGGGAGRVRAKNDADAALFVAFTRERQNGFRSPPGWDNPPPCRAMPPIIGYSDPKGSGPFAHSDGKLKVHVYLDAPRQEAKLGSLGTLDGDPTLGVPEHVHDKSAEALFFREGSGKMRLGDEEIQIKPDTFVYVPPETVHGFTPDSTSRVFAYQVYAPSGPEQRFRK